MKRLRLLWTEISRDREISCKKSEMSCEGHREENVSLADGNKWRPTRTQHCRAGGLQDLQILTPDESRIQWLFSFSSISFERFLSTKLPYFFGDFLQTMYLFLGLFQKINSCLFLTDAPQKVDDNHQAVLFAYSCLCFD